MKKIVLFFIASLTYLTAFSQGIGLNPQNVGWKVLKTDQVNIIYNERSAENAQRAATIIAYLDEKGRRSIGQKNRKFDLVLRDYSAIPNGYVNLAPFRSEFFLTPPESPLLGTLQWADALTIHEYRHALQLMNGRKGLSKLAYFAIGETGQLVANFVAVPNWFFEGDAVVYETALSNTGRGRSANFTQGMRGLAYEDKMLSYGKFRNRSFKDFVPDHYRLGYTILSHVRNSKGNDVTGEIFRGATSYRKVIYPFSREMKAQTGLGTRGMYKEAWNTYAKQWRAAQDRIVENPSERVSQEWNYVTSYRFPKVNSKGQLYAVKSSVRRTPEIMLVEDDGETQIVSLGTSLDSYFDVHDEDFVWSEFTNDARRINQEYSDVILFKDDKKKRLTSKKRYFSPVFSKDGNSIFAVEVAEQGNVQLVKLSCKTGKELSSHDFGKMVHLMRPAVINDNEIVYIYQENSTVRLEKIDWETGSITPLMEATGHTINTPHYNDGYVYFSAGFTGIEDVYRVPVDGRKAIEKITSSKVAAFSPFIDGDGELYYSQFSTDGLYISKSEMSSLARSIEKVSIEKPVDMSWMDDVAETAEGGDILEGLEIKNFDSKEYKGIFRGLRFHSYVPSYDGTTVGFTTTLNNALDDKQIALSAGYNLVTNDISSDVSYRIGNFYPVIDLGVSTRKVGAITNDGTELFNEYAPGVNVFIPLSKLKGLYTMRTTLGVDSRYRIHKNLTLNEVEQEDRSYYTGEFSLDASILRRRAVQNMRSRMGLEIEASYGLATVFEGFTQLDLQGKIYLPGMLANHSTLITGGYRETSINRRAVLADGFDYPRGINQFIPIATANVQKLEVEYAFPLLYPDIGIAGIIYFKRVKANLFWDSARFNGLAEGRTYSAVGIDVIFDNVYFNVIPGSAGFTVGYGTFLGESKLFLTPTVSIDF